MEFTGQLLAGTNTECGFHGLFATLGIEFEIGAVVIHPGKMAVWIAFVLIAVIAVVFLSRRTERHVFVLGQQMADAAANEAIRVAKGSAGPSPMPKGKYDADSGEYGLISVTPLPLDAEFQELTKNFGSWNLERRREAQDAISMDEEYTLIQFAKRSAVLALSENSTSRCEDGVTALSMIDETRIDPRDADWAMGLLNCAIARTRANRESLLIKVATLARAGMVELLRDANSSSKLSDWSFAEVLHEDGSVGLIETSRARYEPTFDMCKLALRIAESLERGRYIAEPAIAQEVPSVWFEKNNRAAAEELLKQACAGISVHGRLRKRVTEDPGTQSFFLWVVEMRTEREASTLRDYVGNGERLSGRFTAGICSDCVFAILVAGSCFEGVAPFESAESLALLAEEMRGLLVHVRSKQ